MKRKPPAEKAEKPTRRKNISLHPDVQKMLSGLAEAEYTTASALLTALIIERAKRVALIPPIPQTGAQSNSPESAEKRAGMSSHSTGATTAKRAKSA
jgi:hypothetical protein